MSAYFLFNLFLHRLLESSGVVYLGCFALRKVIIIIFSSLAALIAKVLVGFYAPCGDKLPAFSH
jgi:hypothetical protein